MARIRGRWIVQIHDISSDHQGDMYLNYRKTFPMNVESESKTIHRSKTLSMPIGMDTRRMRTDDDSSIILTDDAWKDEVHDLIADTQKNSQIIFILPTCW